MELRLVGWPEDDPTLALDHEQFSYAGKFRMSSTGKAVAEEDGQVVAAVAFNEDRTDAGTLWLRYVTVRADRRGEGLGPGLVTFVVERARESGYDEFAIAVNNPFAYEALYRAGFGFSGETTGIAELVLRQPGDRSTAAYRAGYERFAERDLTADGEQFVQEHLAADTPVAEEREG